MSTYTKQQVIEQRKCGLRYFDRACAKIGRENVIAETEKLLTEFGAAPCNGIDWALGNAVRIILNPDNDICQSYNPDEALTRAELTAIAAKFPDAGILESHGWDRKPEPNPITDLETLTAGQQAVEAIQTSTTRQTAVPSGKHYPAENENSTATCKKLLEETHAGNPAGGFKHWKRTAKRQSADGTVREFENKTTGQKATVTIGATGSTITGDGIAADSVETRLAALIPTLPEDPDYGEVFWNPTTRTVWYVAGDGGVESDEIEEILRIDGVLDVVFGNERYPEGDEWTQLAPRPTININDWLGALPKQPETDHDDGPLPPRTRGWEI